MTEGARSASLRDLPLQLRYSTGRNDLLEEFFRPCLSTAILYERAVGFFSSTFYLLVAGTLAEFARRGGKMRIVCCPRLSEVDIAAMQDGYAVRAAANGLVREFAECLEDPIGKAVGTLLATLVAADVIDIRIAFRPGVAGIYHDKVGLFSDSNGDRVSFDGSANESWSAWSESGNYEAFHVFCEWIDANRVAADADTFGRLWEDVEPGLEVIPFPEVARERLDSVVDPEGITHAEQRVQDAVGLQRGRVLAGRPRLRAHQSSVLDDWAAKDHRGIVEHATASGKTITGLTAAATSLAAGYSVVVVVPSATLLDQWRIEATRYWDGSVPLMVAGSGYDEWRVGAHLRNFLEAGGQRVVVVTIDTAATPDFTTRLRDLHPLTVIVDEVHRAGSSQRRRLLEEVDADWRLGLSATWEREGDPGGTAVIRDYFEHVLEPAYTLQDAVRDGHLCAYRYVIHVLSLTESEREAWALETSRISRALAFAHGEMTESVQHLLIRRARIIKKAAGKVALAAAILSTTFRDGDAWLVYCDDTVQLAAVRAAIEARGVQCMEYHRQGKGTEEEALMEFERNGGVVLAIKCLDEGVDIPRIDHALILASSSTRREFIQRRGRVLRRADRKYQAEIHDVLVDSAGFTDPASATFLRNEVARAREFAASAQDSVAAQLLLDDWERRLVDIGLQMDPGSLPEGSGFDAVEGEE